MLLHAIDSGSGPPLVLLHGVFGSARNLGVVQRRFSATHRVIALDVRNHGHSPHAADMSYPVLAADVLETLQHLGALPCDLLGHSMGGKIAMWLALFHPEAVTRLIVADVAPARYRSDFHRYSQAMLALPLVPGLTRAAADAALADAVPDPAVRAFLLLNLLLPADRAASPSWQFGLAEIDAAIDGLVDWPDPARRGIMVRRCSLPVSVRVCASRASGADSRAVSVCGIHNARGRRPLAACRQPGWFRRYRFGISD